ncbi:Uncharacterized [Syntrophomonas zehnderi OL-4]|uniref:Uncharacterized n=1 Tax=Syntrophomonas zehnderi OL-4 TaxID=690567 RepID=A0A0E4GBL1_9FIRM|nr:hypothetical protein [Syntrophomonas zehnderi]CFX49235.1 Uncharacterized [Syntrophomonas zehnderi OL-4]
MLEEWIRGDQNSNKKELRDFKKWSRYLLAIIICLGLLALIWPMGKNQPSSVDIKSAPGSVEQAQDRLGAELENILAQIEGAGQVKVCITLSSNGIKSYASNTRNETRETLEQDRSGGDRKIREENLNSDVAVSAGEALLVEEKAPKISGVLVVAEGADNAAVKERLTDATAVLLNIHPYQVRVVPGKEE